MFLTEVSLWGTVKKQYGYKMNAYLNSFGTLVFLQLIALLFSSSGNGMMGSTGGGISVEVSYISADLLVAFSMLWAFSTAILVTTKAYRYDDFTFVSNRLSTNVSNMLFLMTASVVGGVSSILGGLLLKGAIASFRGAEILGSVYTINDIASGIVATSAYLLLLASVGYVVGMIVQVNKLFSVLLPGLFIGMLYMEIQINGEPKLLTSVADLFVNETSLLLFIGKVLVASAGFFYLATVLSNRLEVR